MVQGQPDLLSGLPPEVAERIMALGSSIGLQAGSVLFNLGGQADNLYVIRRGKITLTLPMELRGGEKDVLVEERSTGETIGWSALVPPHKFTLKATAQVESEVIGLPRAALESFFEANPDVGRRVSLNVAEVIGHRLQLFQAMWLREVQRMVELRYA